MAVYLDFRDSIMRYGRTEAGKTGILNADEHAIYALGQKVVEENSISK